MREARVTLLSGVGPPAAWSLCPIGNRACQPWVEQGAALQKEPPHLLLLSISGSEAFWVALMQTTPGPAGSPMKAKLLFGFLLGCS